MYLLKDWFKDWQNPGKIPVAPEQGYISAGTACSMWPWPREWQENEVSQPVPCPRTSGQGAVIDRQGAANSENGLEMVPEGVACSQSTSYCARS